MARRSLRPNFNQIRTWVTQGRTDAWIAHQLEVTVQQIEAFKRENDLAPEGDAGPAATTADFDDEIDLRAEDDAAIAAELELAEVRRREEEQALAAERATAAAQESPDGDADAEDGEERPRRRGRRGGRGRGRRAATGPLEGTFDHGEEGYGLWLDPAVADDPTYAEHWAGHRPVEITVEEDQIVIRRARAGDDD
ncbi:MAG TPA: hypothetical protein VGV40_07565 [Solirubrobacteraceae bacterium]|nr:hypothetical protein [Solirubrobacteraceae bacterium]